METPANQMANYCSRLEDLFVPAIADVLDDHGICNQVMNHGFMPLFDGCAAGPAFTVREIASASGARRTNDERLRIFQEFFDALQPGQMIVVDTGGCFAAAAWGELMSTISYYTRQARGAVIDGPIRDISRVLSVEFPVWAKGSIPADSDGRLDLIEFDKPMRCGGVLVNPGDIVMADRDGIVVLPMGRVDVGAIISEAEEIVALENKSRADLRNGVSVTEVFKRYGKL